MSLLETQALTVTFGGLRANDGVDITINQGKFVGLIGPNGAGKTTFIDAITGYVLSTGAIAFDGADITRLRPYERTRRGLVRTFQSLELFEDLSVEDNLLAAAQPARWYDFILDMLYLTRVSANVRAVVDHALEVVGLSDTRDRNPTDLSHGQRKLVGVARALAARPKLLLLDEPAAGLDSNESVILGQRLRRLLDEGITLFLIDHDMGLVLNVCDYIYVLNFGKIVAEGTPAQIRTNPVVIEAYLGESAEAAAETTGGVQPGGHDG